MGYKIARYLVIGTGLILLCAAFCVVVAVAMWAVSLAPLWAQLTASALALCGLAIWLGWLMTRGLDDDI